jgi:hypothetical protein
MDEQPVLRLDLPLKLADGLQERLSFNVADGAADLGDDHVLVLGDPVNLVLDLVGDWGG